MTIRPQARPVRIVDRKYREFVKSHGCLLQWAFTMPTLGAPLVYECAGPIDPHHVIPEGGGKMGSKVDDRRCVPLCRVHHDQAGNRTLKYEIDFEREIAILNKEYDTLFPATEKRERQSSARVQHLLILCTCGKVHRIPAGKSEPYDAISGSGFKFRYYCPFLKKDQVASFRRRRA